MTEIVQDPQQIELYEVREPSGYVVLVTSDATAAVAAAQPGDTVFRRTWVGLGGDAKVYHSPVPSAIRYAGVL